MNPRDMPRTKMVREVAPVVTRARRPYTTATPVAIKGATTVGPTANERRRAALDSDRARAVELCAFHYAKKNWAAWRTAGHRLQHVDHLIWVGTEKGRWDGE